MNSYLAAQFAAIVVLVTWGALLACWYIIRMNLLSARLLTSEHFAFSSLWGKALWRKARACLPPTDNFDHWPEEIAECEEREQRMLLILDGIGRRAQWIILLAALLCLTVFAFLARGITSVASGDLNSIFLPVFLVALALVFSLPLRMLQHVRQLRQSACDCLPPPLTEPGGGGQKPTRLETTVSHLPFYLLGMKANRWPNRLTR